MIKEFLEFEERIKNWIEKNRFKWYSILAIVGISLGVVYSLSLTGTLSKAPQMSVAYSFILFIAEYTLGGKGLE
ncbi:MAG: hypothetical protein WD876_02200 [Candidatus Pacearchaeota archaeon]